MDKDVYQTGYRVEDAAGPGALHTAFRSGLDILKIEVPLDYEKKIGWSTLTVIIWETKVFPLNGNFTAS